MKKNKSINIIKKSFISLGLFLIIAIFGINLVSAQTFNFNEGSGLNLTGQKAGYGLSPSSPEIIIGQVIKIVLGFLGVIFLAFMMYAGVTWMTAQGNDQKVTKAKDMITESIVGLIIVVAAYAITYFVINYFSRQM